MGESPRANMMGQRVFIIALIASLCVALPTTDLVVPEAKDSGTSGAEFVQSTLKSGGTETQCRTFATDTISSINAGVTSEQGVLAAIDTGSGCAQEVRPWRGSCREREVWIWWYDDFRFFHDDVFWFRRRVTPLSALFCPSVRISRNE